MADVTGRIGDNEVELNNAATEATLKALLLASAGSVKEMKKLAKLAEKAGMDARAIQDAEFAVEQFSKNSSLGAGSLLKLNPLLGALGKGATFAGNVVGDLAASAFKTAGNLTGLAGSLVDGAGAASDLAGAFKDLPLGLGLVASAFQKLLQLQEAELETYRQLTKTGINFGGSLTTVRLEALSLGMTLEQFGSVITNNSVAMASMGANANEGSKNFVRLAKDLRNSPMGEQLRALGFTAEETANGLANYIQMTGGRTAEEMRNTKGLTESAGQYMKQLDMLATITGKSREEQEKALIEAQQNAAFEAYLQTLDEDGRKKAMAGLAQAMAVGGKGAVQSLQAKLMNLPDITDASQTFRATMGNAAQGVDQMADDIRNSSKTVADVNRSGAGAMAGSFKDIKRFGTTLVGAMSMMGGPEAEAMMIAQANYNRALKQGSTSQEELIKLQNKVIEAQARAESQAAAAAETEKKMRDMGTQVYAALLPAIETLTKYINGDLMTSFSKLAKEGAGKAGEVIKDMIEWFKKFMDPSTRDKALENLMDKIGKMLGAILQKAWANFSIFGGGERTDGRSGRGRRNGQPAPPEGADGAVMSGPKSGFDAVLHGTEAVVPLPNGRSIPVELDMSMPKAMNFQRPDIASLVAEMQKTMKPQQANPFEKLETSITELFATKSETTENDGVGKNLLSELQTLNKQTAEMLAYVRDTADTGRRSIDALRGLSGNLYPV